MRLLAQTKNREKKQKNRQKEEGTKNRAKNCMAKLPFGQLFSFFFIISAVADPSSSSTCH